MDKLNLDWKIQLLDGILNFSKPLEKMSLDELRETSEKPIPPIVERIFGGKRIALADIMQQKISGRHGEIPIRLYYPVIQENLPIILFFHGGGWVYGNFQTHDRMCRRIARDTGAIVLAVCYRLAPFFKYPTALEDCYDVLLWAVKHSVNLKADSERVIVMGDSAGGNLAAAVCLMARDQGHSSIARQILIYPVMSGMLDQPSIEKYANAPILTQERMRYFVQCYARTEADILQPYFSPLLAQDLNNLPPTLIITSEYDPLHDQAHEYAQRLQEAGTPVTLIDYSDMVHGFLSFPAFCREALPTFYEIAKYVKLLNA
ncbi:alpha/beta hydrolase [Chamaesiphon minutus]|uniref:Esterase/lipase n=1 Tax=Chamaesiphon minutus (strain ATCC 27169 / PCC 6605) TaxID=1173020 RepID=K9URV4_CHAP6|nr:alpha/beta hydrolase [Chamaesiphon minutus]AFY97004.1 esterase/lipase [Chamaesiphon minutus PCC 6605]